MYTIKGFARIAELANNSIGSTPVLGELSTESLTYGRERHRGYHLDASKGIVEFVSFQCKQHSTSQLVPVPTTYSTLILSVVNWLYGRAKAQTVAATPALVAAQIAAEFNTSVQQVQCGAIVAIGNIRLPSFVRFVKTEGSNDNQVQIWFSDPAFKLEYDATELVIIPPVEELDSLFESSPIVEGLLNSRGMDQLFALKEEVIGVDPPTDEVAQVHDRKSILSPTTLKTNWIILIYGAAGNDPDTIRQALVDYILANSERTEAEWRVLIPSLFVKTEFIIVPHWDRIAIPNEVEGAGQYSSFVAPNEPATYAALGAAGGPNNYAPYIRTFPTTFKSLSCTSYGGVDNADGIRDLRTKFPDFINVHTSSADFGRMSPTTQNWVRLLYTLIQAAETMTATSGLVTGVKRSIRNNKVFAVGTYLNVQYYVYAKSNF